MYIIDGELKESREIQHIFYSFKFFVFSKTVTTLEIFVILQKII